MNGLLAKAEVLKNRIRTRSGKSTQADFFADKEAEVMAEMNSILEKGRSEITYSSLAFIPQSSGIKFPLLINIGAITLLAVLGGLFFFLLNQVEITLVQHEKQISSAEGLIIEVLREASEEELSEKENQIASIQTMLSDAEKTKASLIEEFDKERIQIQAKLRQELNLELDTERQRLVAEGLSGTAISSRLATFEQQKQGEYDQRLASINADFDRQLEERSALFNDQMDQYNRSLAQAQEEQDSIKRSLEQQLANARQESARNLETIGADKATALDKLEKLTQQQSSASLQDKRIQSVYDSVNSSLKQDDYPKALAELNRLEDFIRFNASAERRNTEQFLIDSLRRLISSELAAKTSKPPGNDPAIAAQSLLASVSSRVAEGNRLYAAGNLEAARVEYTAALKQIPELDTSYLRLQELLNLQTAQERALFERQLSESVALYRDSQYKPSIEKYRQALSMIAKDSPSASTMLDRILDAGYQIRKASEPLPEPVVIREELTEEEKDLLRRAQSAEIQRSALLDSLEQLKTRYSKSNAEPSTSSSKESLMMLLNAKLLIRRALSDKTIRKAYPELYQMLDMVFATYGEEQRIEGRSQALEDIVSLTDYLGLPEENSNRPSIRSADDTRLRKLLLEFLGNLQTLIGSAGQT